MSLKPFGPEDAEFLYRWWNDREYSGDYEPFEPVTREELDKWLASPKPSVFWYVIEAECGKVGQLMGVVKGDGSAKIGYRVIPPARGRGYCTEAIKLLASQIFAETDMTRITAEANPGNLASIKVLQKACFTRVGYVEKDVEINGVWMDGVVYELKRR